MKTSDIHIDKKFAARLPDPSAEEFSSLKESIRQSGIMVPLLVTDDGLLLDGHRRLQAAKALGIDDVPTKKVSMKSDGDSWDKTVVIATNLYRRHLNVAQRADLGSSLLRIERVAAVERMRDAGKAAGKGRPKAQGVDGGHPPLKKDKDRASERVAKAVGVNRQTVERVEAVKRADPALAKKMLDGDICVSGAFKKVKVQQIKATAAAVPDTEPGRLARLQDARKEYQCVYADPPWRYDNAGSRGAAEQHYPTMRIGYLSMESWSQTRRSYPLGLVAWCTYVRSVRI